MSAASPAWAVSVLDLVDEIDVGLDDIDSDPSGRAYVTDGVGARVYRLSPPGDSVETFSLADGSTVSRGSVLSISVAPDSSFYVADTESQTVSRFDSSGRFLGDFPAPGVMCLCTGANDSLMVLSSSQGVRQVAMYDSLGSPISTIPAPMSPYPIDPSLVSMEADGSGCAYISYGMPPYSVWKLSPDGAHSQWTRELACPEQAVLIADLGVDVSAGIVWVLLAVKQYGRQVLDAFTLDGEFISTVEIPQSGGMYDEMCCAGNRKLYLLNTGMSGSGELACIEAAP